LRRRDVLLAVLAGSSVAAARSLAQSRDLPVIGFISVGPVTSPAYLTSVEAFREGLASQGYEQDRNVAFLPARPDGPQLSAEELVRRPVALIVSNDLQAARTAMETNPAVPIVFATRFDPVRAGLIRSLNRPGGNATGVTSFGSSVDAKRLELLRDMLPAARRVAVLRNPTGPDADGHLGNLETAARDFGMELVLASASTEAELEPAFATLAAGKADVFLLAEDNVFTPRYAQIVPLAARLGLPTVYPGPGRAYVRAGGLIGYGPDGLETARTMGVYAGRILAGEKPADLPVAQPRKFDLVINLKTARALGLRMPDTLLARATAVIE